MGIGSRRKCLGPRRNGRATIGTRSCGLRSRLTGAGLGRRSPFGRVGREQFLAHDDGFQRRLDADPHAVGTDSNDRDRDPVPNLNPLGVLPRQHQHRQLPVRPAARGAPARARRTLRSDHASEPVLATQAMRRGTRVRAAGSGARRGWPARVGEGGAGEPRGRDRLRGRHRWPPRCSTRERTHRPVRAGAVRGLRGTAARWRLGPCSP